MTYYGNWQTAQPTMAVGPQQQQQFASCYTPFSGYAFSGYSSTLVGGSGGGGGIAGGGNTFTQAPITAPAPISGLASYGGAAASSSYKVNLPQYIAGPSYSTTSDNDFNFGALPVVGAYGVAQNSSGMGTSTGGAYSYNAYPSSTAAGLIDPYGNYYASSSQQQQPSHIHLHHHNQMFQHQKMHSSQTRGDRQQRSSNATGSQHSFSSRPQSQRQSYSQAQIGCDLNKCSNEEDEDDEENENEENNNNNDADCEQREGENNNESRSRSHSGHQLDQAGGITSSGGGHLVSSGVVNDQLSCLTPHLEAAYEAMTGGRRQPVIKRQVITVPGTPGRIQQVVRRLPTPTPDIVERVFVVKPQRDVINLVIERPGTPPAQYKDRTVMGKQRRPLIHPRIVRVAARTGANGQMMSSYFYQQLPYLQQSSQQQQQAPSSITMPYQGYPYSSYQQQQPYVHALPAPSPMFNMQQQQMRVAPSPSYQQYQPQNNQSCCEHQQHAQTPQPQQQQPALSQLSQGHLSSTELSQNGSESQHQIGMQQQQQQQPMSMMGPKGYLVAPIAYDDGQQQQQQQPIQYSQTYMPSMTMVQQPSLPYGQDAYGYPVPLAPVPSCAYMPQLMATGGAAPNTPSYYGGYQTMAPTTMSRPYY